jgi:hypothetical protein
MGIGQRLVGDETKKGGIPTFGALERPSDDAAKAKALAWFKVAVNNDAAKLQQFAAIWNQTERPVLDRVTDSLILGDATAARLLAEARNVEAPAPTSVPPILTDNSANAFYRANLALAYARALSGRRVHEEALAVLKTVNPEQVVDPSSYLFHRAVCEHALLLKQDATKTVGRLIQDAVDSPERYKTVGALMLLDMQTWKEKDLAAIARKMDNIERRLDLSRGGPETQKIQREVIARLDELIKELENKAKKQQQGGGDPNGGGCPDGGQPGDGQKPGGSDKVTKPMPDSMLPSGTGTGRVDITKIRKMEEGWGKMTPRQRADAMQQLEDLTQGLDPAHQEAFRNYFRGLATDPNKR